MTCENTTAEGCTKCDEDKLRVKDGNSCPCKERYFSNNSDICEGCHYSCFTCDQNT